MSRIFLSMLVLVACAPKYMPEREANTGPRTHFDVAMPDGVRLDTHVLLPDGDGPFPAVLIRVPYPMGPVINTRCAVLNRHGYACVWQSVRGRNKSEGDWLPFEHEPSDGLATIRWLASQRWVDGNIALMGESYLGAVQWAVTEDLPPEVKTMVPMMIGTDLYETAYEGGLFRHELGTAWMSLMPGERFRFVGGARGYHRALRHRPRLEMDVVSSGEELPWFRAWLAADTPDAPFWSRDVVKRGLRAPARTTIPVLMMAGWADVFIGPQLTTWSELATQSDSTLVIGPWNHLGGVATDVKQADVDAGHGHNYLQWPRIIDWFDHHLKGEPLRFEAGKVVSYPINGDGWVTHDSWPPPTAARSWPLGPGGDPASCTGQLTQGAGEVTWTYDPSDPTPALGGAGLLAGVLFGWHGVEPGFQDQGRLCERRDDLLGFLSEPLPDPMHVAGPLRATLRFATDAEDTGLNVRFLEERANGDRIMVRGSIVRLSHRDGVGTATYTPGDVVTVELETWPVDYVFEAGSRLLVQVASASFPQYEAPPNVAGPWATVTETRVAQQRLVLEGSSVELPVGGGSEADVQAASDAE
jgi:putative CocE/NonD family hydrolase